MIHESAYIDPNAQLAPGISVGPNSYIGPGVTLGPGCIVHNNATITGNTSCGAKNEFYPGCVIGSAPQDLKYKGSDTRLEIGDENIFREMVTIHAGTETGGRVTRVGARNRLLVGVHVAHDVLIGNECIISNQVQLAGHVRIEDRVTMGGLIGVHHFATIGTLAFIGGLTRIVADVPPYMIVEGNPSSVRGFNIRGMRRWGLSEDRIRSVREAYRILFSQKAVARNTSMLERLAELESRTDLNGEVRYLCESIRRSHKSGVNGRWLESQRQDEDADREAFYGAINGENGKGAS